MRLAITQPAYLPWTGYFDLIDQADTFVLLDCVQFERQSWQHRNRIKTPLGLQWLTIPVQFRGRFGQKIQEVELRVPDFWRSHLRTIQMNYARSRYFQYYFPLLLEQFQQVADGRLCNLTAALVSWLMKCLGIKREVVLASSLHATGKRSGLLANICKELGADEYLSPIGSAEYLLSELSFFGAAGVTVHFHNYVHPIYQQLFQPFIPYACVLDLIFNEGPGAMEIIRSGRRPSISAEQLRTERLQLEATGS